MMHTMSKRPPKHLSNDDQKLWDLVVRDVRLLKHPDFKKLNLIIPQEPIALKSAKPPVKYTKLDASHPLTHSPAKHHTAQHKSSFQTDKNTHKKLKQGRLDIDATLDLHGYSLARAHTAFLKFVAVHIRAGSRVLLVVTGKGKGGEGVIRASLKEWAHEPSIDHWVLKITQAAAEDGGAGAFYILLRRRRP